MDIKGEGALPFGCIILKETVFLKLLHFGLLAVVGRELLGAYPMSVAPMV
jgi:hypothetical protein